MHNAYLRQRGDEFYGLTVTGPETNCLMHVKASELLDLWQILPTILDENPETDLFSIDLDQGTFVLSRGACDAIIDVIVNWYPSYTEWLEMQSQDVVPSVMDAVDFNTDMSYVVSNITL